MQAAVRALGSRRKHTLVEVCSSILPVEDGAHGGHGQRNWNRATGPTDAHSRIALPLAGPSLAWLLSVTSNKRTLKSNRGKER